MQSLFCVQILAPQVFAETLAAAEAAAEASAEVPAKAMEASGSSESRKS